MHRCDDPARSFGVIAGDKIFSAVLRVPEFEIRHVDVDQTVHPLNAFGTIIGRSVVDQRQPQTAFDGNHERFKDLRHYMLGRDEVDVVAADFLKVEHDASEFRGSHLRAFAELAGLEIFAENAA